MKKQFLILMAIAIAVGMYGLMPVQKATAATAATAVTKTYSDITFDLNSGNFYSQHASDIWDLTAGNLTVNATFDVSGVTAAGCWYEYGMREYGANDFNPSNKGGWLCGGTTSLASDNTNSNHNEKINLQAIGGKDEKEYNILGFNPTTVQIPAIGTYDSYGLWFDRDGVSTSQATLWGSVNGGTYNTAGKYATVNTYGSISNTQGAMFVIINNVSQGFWSSGWKNAQPERYPAGLSFNGDLKHMQFFAGIWAPATGGGTVKITGISITGYLRYEPVTVKVRSQGGAGMASVPVEYDEGSGYVSGGNTDANGDWNKDILSNTNLKVRVKYNGQWIELAQNIMTNFDFLFTLGEGNFELLSPPGELAIGGQLKVKYTNVTSYVYDGQITNGSKKVDLIPGTEVAGTFGYSPISSMLPRTVTITKTISGSTKFTCQLWRLIANKTVKVKSGTTGADITSSCSIEFSWGSETRGYNAFYDNGLFMPGTINFRYKKLGTSTWTTKSIDLMSLSYGTIWLTL